MAGELSRYLQDAYALVHDYNRVFTPQNQMISWVNTVRRSMAKRTGCIQRLITGQSAFGASSQPGFAVPGGMQPGALPGATPGGTVAGAASNSLQTIPGQERYPFKGFFDVYLRQQYGGCDVVTDAASLAVNWGGAVRPQIAWLPFEDFQAYCRAYATLVTSYPYYWTVYNDGANGEVWMFPAPSTTGDIELNAYCLPIKLYTDDDVEAIPAEQQDAVKYGAAALAFAATYRYGEAQQMERAYLEALGVDVVSRDRGKIAQFYQPAI
jgi:hypothetical protein